MPKERFGGAGEAEGSIAKYKKEKYSVDIFNSGSGELYQSTRALLV